MNDYQKQFILNNYQTMTVSDICSIMNVKPHQVNYFLRQSGIKRKEGKKKTEWANFTESDIEFMINNYSSMEYSEIAYFLNKTEKQVRSKINNIVLTKLRRFNDHYFDQIDTPLKAYLIGFIFADGWVVHNPESRNYEFGMQLQAQDKYVLDKINDEIGGNHIVQHYDACQREICGVLADIQESYRIRIYSKNLVEGLINNGVETNKTLKTIYPIVKDDLFFDFLRGYIDGDGCFYINDNKVCMHITSSFQEIFQYLQNKLLEYNIHTSIYKEKDRKFRLCCFDINSMNLLINHLYYRDGLFCLQRKYEIVNKYIGLAA